MIYQTALYRVKKGGIALVKEAIEEFTKYVKENEPGTLLYMAWQQKEDPQTFMHFFCYNPFRKKYDKVYSLSLI